MKIIAVKAWQVTDTTKQNKYFSSNVLWLYYRVVENLRPCQQGRLKFVWTDNFMEIFRPNDRLKKSGIMLIFLVGIGGHINSNGDYGSNVDRVCQKEKSQNRAN